MTRIFIMPFVVALATISYSIYYNAPKKAYSAIFVVGLLGGVSYEVFRIIFENTYLTTLMAAFVMGSLSEMASRIVKMPAPIFIIPAIISYVPGASMYFMMYYLVQQDMPMALQYSKGAAMTAGAMAFGLLLSTVMSRSINFRKIYLFRKK